MKQIEVSHGLVAVYTGQGKGKTTAALGVALRAAGHGLKVIMIQFPKAGLDYGEYHFLDKYPVFELVRLNKGKTATQTEAELHAIIRETYGYAEQVLFEGHHHIVILDEIFGALEMKVLATEDVLDLIRIKPHWVSLILTGQKAPGEIAKQADTVTEMVMVKHHFAEGPRRALEGIDY